MKDIQRNLTGSKISTSYTKFVFFGPNGQIRWPPWPLIGWDIFDFSSKTTERNSTKLIKKQDLNILYQVCVFRADRKNKMAVLASDWLRHFRLLLWNCWTEFYETWQEAGSQRPLPSLCFSGRSEKQDDRPAFSICSLKLLNEICRNFTGRRTQRPLPSLRFSGRSEKQDGRPASDWLRHFRLLWNPWTELNKTWLEARTRHPPPSLCFFGQIIISKCFISIRGIQVHDCGPLGLLFPYAFRQIPIICCRGESKIYQIRRGIVCKRIGPKN